MANAQRGEVALTVGGADYILRLGTNALCNLEDELGGSVVDIFSGLEKGGVSIKLLRSILFWGLTEQHPELSRDDVGDLIDDAGGVEAVGKLITKAVSAGMPKSKGKGGKPAGKKKGKA
ncbi:MAG: GTA-gp10 family protein [Pseudoruegeria sp.]